MTVIYQLNQFFKLCLRHFLLYGGSSTEQKTFLGSHSYWETCYQVTCSVSPLPTQQVELIWMEMSTGHLFFKFFLFVFHLFSIFLKKIKIKKLLPSTLDKEPSTPDPRHKDRLLKKVKGIYSCSSNKFKVGS